MGRATAREGRNSRQVGGAELGLYRLPWRPALDQRQCGHERGAFLEQGQVERLERGPVARGVARHVALADGRARPKAGRKASAKPKGSRTAPRSPARPGSSETIQKRALITPDEIGQVFARVDDRERVAYPGLALAVISGARPVVAAARELLRGLPVHGAVRPASRSCLRGGAELSVEGRDLGFTLCGVRAEDRRLVGEGRTDRGRRRRGRRGAGDERHGRRRLSACRARG